MSDAEDPGRPFTTDTKARREQSARCVAAARAAASAAAVDLVLRLVSDDPLPQRGIGALWPVGQPDDPD